MAAPPYTGPLFDAHLHYNDDAVGRYSIGTLHELFSKNGVRAILANSRPNDGTRALVEAAKAGARKDLAVVPFIRVYRDRADYGTWQRNPEILAMIVAEEKRGYYRGVGEFHVHGKDADTKVLKDIVDFAVAKGLVLHAHSDDEAIEIIFRHNPKASVIWAHTGFTTPLARVEEMLAKYPRLWGELSYRSDVAEGGALSEGWRALFLRHPDRFVVGSDTWVNERWDSYPSIMGGYRRWLGELPREVAESIAWKNGARIFGLP
ncbi:amidohydrolase family protein [Usitatibacter palustris]|uniref:amidohydrolase family protein n=1 Tax=Usitatibacter palustris TaxID=2732487 RepID=UPI001BB22E09|nr:amidohydrolase family protein [Usitatibacter palustris]